MVAGTARVWARVVAGTGVTEVFVSALAPATADGARAAYAEIARALESHGAAPFQERVFAPIELRDVIAHARSEALASCGADPSTPWLALAHEGALAVQLWAVAFDDPRGRSIATLEIGGARGRLRTNDGAQLLWVPGLRGDPACPVSVQAEQMFERAEDALWELGLSFGHVARTWIYARRLLDWYGELNRARTEFYAARGIGVDRPFPASTGIQGRSEDEECTMDVLAARDVAVDMIDQSARQSSAYGYGSSFSRGVCIDAGAPLFFASGTASIDRDGRTLHAGAPELQAIETLLSVGALLETRGTTLREVVSGVVFYASDTALAAYERACALLCLPDLPLVPVRADICRPELAIEIECVASMRGGAT